MYRCRSPLHFPQLLLLVWMAVVSEQSLADGYRTVNTEAVLCGAIGGGTGAAVGSALGGRNGAIIGSAIGAATGVAIATPKAPSGHGAREFAYMEERHHHDHGKHLGHKKHHNHHHD